MFPPPFQLTISGQFTLKSGSVQIEVKATFINSEQVLCEIPDKKIYEVVVSNVKKTTVISTTIIFVSFDSICYECDKTGCANKVSITSSIAPYTFLFQFMLILLYWICNDTTN